MTSYRQVLMERLENDRDISDEEILGLIDDLLTDSGSLPHVPLGERMQLRMTLFNSVRRLDILQELLDDPSVTEVMVNGVQGIFLERDGTLIRWGKSFEKKEKLEDIVQQIVAGCNRAANESNAIVDARLTGGARVNVVMPPVALNGPIVTIRRFPEDPISMEKLIAWNSVSAEVVGFLRKLVRAGYNIFISGGCRSGKTTYVVNSKNPVSMRV